MDTFEIPKPEDLCREAAKDSPHYNPAHEEMQRRADTGSLTVEQMRRASSAVSRAAHSQTER